MNDSKVRRRAALIVLALLAFILFQTISRDLPHEQAVVFRFPLGERTSAEELTASFTRVGEREARAGVTLSLRELKGHDVRCSVHLPNGDYIVTVELTHDTSESATDTPKKDASPNKKSAEDALTGTNPENVDKGPSRNRVETLVVRRVTLEGAESIVPLGARTSE